MLFEFCFDLDVAVIVDAIFDEALAVVAEGFVVGLVVVDVVILLLC